MSFSMHESTYPGDTLRHNTPPTHKTYKTSNYMPTRENQTAAKYEKPALNYHIKLHYTKLNTANITEPHSAIFP